MQQTWPCLRYNFVIFMEGLRSNRRNHIHYIQYSGQNSNRVPPGYNSEGFMVGQCRLDNAQNKECYCNEWRFNFMCFSGAFFAVLRSSLTLRFTYCRYTATVEKLIVLQMSHFTDSGITFPCISLNVQRKCRHLSELYFMSCTSFKKLGKCLGSMQSRNYIRLMWAITFSYNFSSRPTIGSGCNTCSGGAAFGSRSGHLLL